MLTLQTRVALLRSYTGMKGLSVRDTVFNGQRLVAVRHTENYSGDEILFDPVTGRAAGMAHASLHPDSIFIQPSTVQPLIRTSGT